MITLGARQDSKLVAGDETAADVVDRLASVVSPIDTSCV